MEVQQRQWGLWGRFTERWKKPSFYTEFWQAPKTPLIRKSELNVFAGFKKESGGFKHYGNINEERREGGFYIEKKIVYSLTLF